MELKELGISTWTEENGWEKPTTELGRFLGIDILS